MMMRLLNLPIVLCLPLFLFFCSCEESTDTPDDHSGLHPPPLDVHAQNQLIGRSINLGNCLEAPNEGDWGLVIQEDWFPIISDAGFTGIRVPVRWSAHAEVDSPYTIDPTFLQRVDWVMDQALKNDLAVVFNIHHYEEMFTDPVGERSRLLALWRQIATHYANASDSLIFELFNEPHDEFTAELWNAYLAEGIELIRGIDPRRTLMIGTAGWGGLSALDDLVLPADSNLIFTIHYYEPFHFTHQGAEWVDNADDWLGTAWTGSLPEKAAVEAHFEQIRQWAAVHDLPVHVGEFGAYHRADMDSRFHWTQWVVQVCEARDFSWAYWEFGSGFGAYDLEAGRWNELRHALIQP